MKDKSPQVYDVIWKDPHIPEPRYFRPGFPVTRKSTLIRLEQLGYSYYDEEYKKHVYTNDNIAVILINIVMGQITALEVGVIDPLKSILSGSMSLLFNSDKYRNTFNGDYKPVPKNKTILL